MHSPLLWEPRIMKKSFSNPVRWLFVFGFISSVLAGATQNQDPFVHAFANPQDNPDLPRVLIIGDSISIGYTPLVRGLLKDEANVHRPATNCRWSAYGANEILNWLGEGKWDVIHFNFGLWDWYGWKQEKKATPQSYAKNLQKIVDQLKTTGASLVFGMTTPPSVTEERGSKLMVSLDRANRFNQEARDVMNKNGVRINDLYSVIGNKREVYQKGPNDVHYNQEGRQVLANAVATEIRRSIEQKGKPRKSVLFLAGNTKHRHGFHEYKAGCILMNTRQDVFYWQMPSIPAGSPSKQKFIGMAGRKMNLSLMGWIPASSTQTGVGSWEKSTSSFTKK